MIVEGFAKDGEICPGMTVEQHAESLSMFRLHNSPARSEAWELALRVLTHRTTDELYGRL